MEIDCTIIVMPPMTVEMPSPGSEMVRAVALHDGIECDIIYYNQKLVSDNLIKGRDSNFMDTLPFICLYHEFISQDMKVYNLAFSELKKLRGTNDETTAKYLESLRVHIYKQAIMVTNISVVAFSSKYHQWISASVLAHLIKKNNPSTKIYLGGQNTKSESEAMKVLCPDIDYFGWGEGEYPFCHMVRNTINGLFTGNARTLTRYQNSSICNNASEYWSLREMMPLQLDKFLYSKDDSKDIVIPIERSRSCHWNRCSFCFLSQGYKFRIKDNAILICEIEHYIKRYGIYQFQFLDNDIVCGDYNAFESLLDDFIIMRKKYPSLTFTMAEISPSGIIPSVIKKLALAGFKSLQIGLETLSPKAMLKFNKKQSLEENISFIKAAINVGIKLVGLNIIINYPDEEIEDIITNIDNLNLIKDFISQGHIDIHMPPLMVSHYSKYMRMVEATQQETEYSYNRYYKFIYNQNITNYNRFDVFQFSKPILVHEDYWKLFYKKIQQLKSMDSNI